MQKNNHPLSKSAAFLLEDIFGGESAGYTPIEDADYTASRKLRVKLNFKSESVQ